MKKLFILLFFSGLICLLGSCKNEAKISYEKLRAEYEQANNNSPELIEVFINKIDSHLSKFPTFEKNSELESIKASLMAKIEQIIFETLKRGFEDCYSYKFQEYDEAINKFNQLRTQLSEFIQQSNNEQNVSITKGYVEKIDNSLNSISQERQDYFSATSSNNINDIETFLSNYPNTVMRGSLLDKIDEIYFTEFMSSVKSSANSITEINSNVITAKNYLNKIQNVEAKSKIVEIINSLESQRRPILEAELGDKLQNLIESMEYAARSEASDARPTYTVEMCVARGSNPEVVGYSSNFERIYQVNMKGSFLGIDKRELEIAVSGRIKGDLNSGVTTSITGSRIISDRKY